MSVSNFNKLVEQIQKTHQTLQAQSTKAVNVGLTIRNWLIGLYIVEFEQNGEDRAKYGDNLLTNLSKRLEIRGLSETNLKNSRIFYLAYSEIRQLITDGFLEKGQALQISQFATDESNEKELELNFKYLRNIIQNTGKSVRIRW